MRHPYAVDAIGESFWAEPNADRTALVLPLCPDSQVGRIAQQSSCFTLHMHRAAPCKNPTIGRFRIPWDAKGLMLGELRRLNIDEFTIYAELDQVSREIFASRVLRIRTGP
jgi:hypothetical protein